MPRNKAFGCGLGYLVRINVVLDHGKIACRCNLSVPREQQVLKVMIRISYDIKYPRLRLIARLDLI